MGGVGGGVKDKARSSLRHNYLLASARLVEGGASFRASGQWKRPQADVRRGGLVETAM